MFSLFKKNKPPVEHLMSSQLYSEKTFYKKFINDLKNCQEEVIIESPFITSSRMKVLFPILANLVVKGIKIYIITRNPLDHDAKYSLEAELEIQRFENSGIQVLLCHDKHHRKLAILDREILWEGSLNILSQIRSCEIMRRTPDEQYTLQMFTFIGFDRFL